VCRLRLVPEETVAAGALQLGLWGGVGEADERAGRALVRVQALLGPEAVVTAVLGGGRDPAERVRLVPWGDDREGGGAGRGDPEPPWPGRLPAPSPAVVPPEPLPAELCDSAGNPVRLAAPDVLTASPHTLAVDGGPPAEVRGWAGPWPVWPRWWAPEGGGGRGSLAGSVGDRGADRAREPTLGHGTAGSRLQVVRADGAAHLLLGRDDRWWVTGTYD
jgi:protein ImuB